RASASTAGPQSSPGSPSGSGVASATHGSIPMRVTTRARRCPSSSTRWPPSERARSSASWAIVPTACVSRVPSSFVQTASRRPPVRCATSTALSAGAAAVTSVSDASGKRQISRRGRTGSRRLPEGASPGSMVRGMVLRPAPEAPRPFAGEHRGQALTAVAWEQLDVVLADARDPLEIAAGPRDRHPGHLAAERGAVARLARDAARRAPAGVPGVAKVDDRVRRALLELATRLGQLEADRLLPLRGRLQATRDTPAAHELPQSTLPTKPGEEGLSAFLRHPPHARRTDVRILAEAEREGTRPGTTNTIPFIRWRSRSGWPTVHTLPRPSSNVSTTARSGAGRAPVRTSRYSEAESVW